MRQIGSVNSQKLAERFGDFLTTEKISFQVDPLDDVFAIWILDEDSLEQARKAFAEFQENPEAPQFVQAEQRAREIVAEKIEKASQRLRQQIDIRKQSQPPTQSQLLITYLLIAISVMVTLKYQIEGNSFGIFSKLSIAEIHDIGGDSVQWNRTLQEVQDGEVWRLITPIFTHMDPLHLLFNMYMMHLFGQLLEPRIKSWRFLLLVLATAICSNLVQYYWWSWVKGEWNGPMFGGMSGVLYALLGFAWAKRDWEPRRGITVDQTTVHILIGWMFFCMLGLMPIANAAHVSGLISGYLIAIVRPVILKLTRKKTDPELG